ncbi:transcription mediator subunit Med12 protein [Rutstroemia sp. NJR-2017a WRK4]|nr:transcription mediator subunit Med12 protein [Rutstroemia sp. NJR-2017a WRK4]
MTTKPLVGSQAQRQSQSQSQRPLNTASIGRPSPHRSLSSTSASRRHNENTIDLTVDVPDFASARYGSSSRTGSRLKQELLNDPNGSGQSEIHGGGSSSLLFGRPPLPMRGRPQLHSDLQKSRPSNIGILPEQTHSHTPAKLMPLPVRPGRHPPPPIEKFSTSQTNHNKKDIRPKPYVLEVPAAAPSYTPNGHADFFPWHGNHPEDQFSESVIRQGFFDKTQMTQNETGTAKTSIYPSLKHKSGLQTLSSLFTSVLAQRRAHGNITANSTFKPPPRVTVTDTKREIWLKDLANPTISLRRLSRSIPHGIRGKVLLEHSLSKNIPIERAVWLAKCVGANELRSFRRKGASGAFAMGGETKWVRDFTVCVEQVLEGIIGSCGEKDFRRRINYAIRLAAHLHEECLLDREHYMDWILSSLESTSQSKLPMWLLIAQVYWKDILRHRRFGRRLAAALLARFSEATEHPDRDILGPLVDRLRLLLKDLLLSGPDNFLSPETWSKYGETLRLSLTGPDDSHLCAVWQELDHRNLRLTTLSSKSRHFSQQRLFRALDKVLSTTWTNDIVDVCWQLDNDKTILLHGALDWSTSSYRPGRAKVFIGARLLRSWSHLGVDVTAAVLSFIDASSCEVGRNKPAFYNLICELARSKDFCVSTYFQWLIGRGGIQAPTDLAPTGPCATRLLAEIPIHDLSEGMIALRKTLLLRAGYALDKEEEQIAKCIEIVKSSISEDLPAPHDESLQTRGQLEYIGSLLTGLTRAGKSELGCWLRDYSARRTQLTHSSLDSWPAPSMGRKSFCFNAIEFSFVRECLETIEDLAMLADVIKYVASSHDSQILSSCADTLNLHITSFAAIGVLKELFDTLVSRMQSLADDQDTIARGFLVSLVDLSTRIPNHQVISSQLSRQLSLSDKKHTADACSPVSDHMAGVLQNDEADFIDEIEKVLANGTSMDQGTMERLFHKVIGHWSSSWEKSLEQQRKCVQLLSGLRDFNAQSFDSLMTLWLSRILNLAVRPSMLQICGPLLGIGCLSIIDLSKICLRLVQHEVALERKIVGRLAMELLAILVRPLVLPGLLTRDETYRARLFQEHMLADSQILTLSIVRHAFEACSRSVDEELSILASRTSDLLTGAVMHELLQTLVLSSVESTTKTLVFPVLYGDNDKASTLLNAVINKLLDPAWPNEIPELPLEATLRLANDLTLPFCQLKVTSAFGSGDHVKINSQRLHSTIPFDDLNRAIDSVILSGDTTWTCIIPSLDLSVIQHLRRGTENQLLTMFHSIRASNFNDILQKDDQLARAESLLLILDLTISTISRKGPVSIQYLHNFFPDLIAILNGAWQFVANAHNTPLKAMFVSKWLPILLSFTGSQTAALEQSKLGHEHRGRILLVLTAIYLEMHILETNVEYHLESPLQKCYDLALHLVDVLPEDTRQQCIRSLRDVASSSKTSYIFSIMANSSDWLYISHGDRVAGTGKHSSLPNSEFSPEGTSQLIPFILKRWEMLGEPTPNMGENDTSLSLTLFASRRAID